MTVSTSINALWKLLDEVKDPEIPQLSIVELGMIRGIAMNDGQVTVKLAPTYSGCPALELIRVTIQEKLENEGVVSVKVELVISPPWSTDWISPEGRRKLKAAGIAPPAQYSALIDLSLIEPVSCPYCGSRDTRLTNSFGPSLCRAISVCNHCRQPFEMFKPL